MIRLKLQNLQSSSIYQKVLLGADLKKKWDYRLMNINQRKIEESKMMIQSGVPVGEIARRLGFYDLSHYYRTFKKHTGVTPQHFRDTNVVAWES